VINPLDALSALTQQMQVPANGAGANALPTGASGAPSAFSIPGMGGPNAITENANLLNAAPTEVPAIVSPSVGSVSGPSTWGHMIQQMVLDVNSKQQGANAMVADVLKGGPTPVHQAMVASEEASLSFEFLAEMRNKVVEAYQQVMQMQV
jgi:flagellar hook-basal body complex protein FliE